MAENINSVDIIGGKTHDQALEAPKKLYGLVLLGWIWKDPKHMTQWVFTSVITKRGYPSGSLFIPVYGSS